MDNPGSDKTGKDRQDIKRRSPLAPPNNNLSEDELLLKSFMDLMQIKADRGEFQRIVAEPEDRHGIERVLRPGMILGGITSAAAFLFLRRAPKWFMNRSLAQKHNLAHGERGNPFFHLVRRQKNPLMPRVTTNQDGSTKFHEGWLLSPLFILLDATFSLALGGAVWFYATPQTALFEAAADIPLVPGRSAVSDTLCDDFIENYNRIPKKLWDKYKEGDEVTVNLKRFIENCRRRKQFERHVRWNNQLQDNEPVEIPHPGVPKNLIIEEDVEESDQKDLVWGEKPREGFWTDDWDDGEDDDDDEEVGIDLWRER